MPATASTAAHAAATAAVIRWRCEQLGALAEGGPTPVVDAMFSRNEPRTGVSGTLAWAVDVDNPATNEQFTLTLKEVVLPTPEGGSVTRPCAMGFSGNYPKALDGLARLLSLDMRVMDPGWIARLKAAARDLGLPDEEVPSGAGHDAAVFANAGIPSAMIFVRNEHGSHNPREAMAMADFLAGIAVMREAVREAVR